MTAITVTLPQEAIDQLKAIAKENHRKPRDQAAYLLTEEIVLMTKRAEFVGLVVIDTPGDRAQIITQALHEWRRVGGTSDTFVAERIVEALDRGRP